MDTTHSNHTLVRPGDPAPGTLYSHTLRTPTARWWKPLLGILAAVVAYLILSVALFAAAYGVDVSIDPSRGQAYGTQMTPALFAAALCSLIVLIPVTWFAVRVMHGQRLGFTGSVVGRLRWGMMFRALPVMVVVYAVYMAAFMLLAPQMGMDAGNATQDSLAYALISLFLMPFQAAAEEVFFRGYVLRGVGSWFSSERAAMIVGTLVSSLLFMAAHGAGDLWLNLYYFTFGVSLAVAARLTGGIEIPILVHVVNNVVSGVIGAYTMDMQQAFNRSAGVGGPFMLVQIAFIALSVVVLVRWTRRRREQVVVPPAPAAGIPGPAQEGRPGPIQG